MDSFFLSIVDHILTFVFGFFSGIYLPLKFRKSDKIPNVSIGKFNERGNCFSIANHGGDILDLEIIICWQQDGVKQERKMEQFLNEGDDPIHTYPHSCSCLKKNETKNLFNCPMFSDDGKVEVFVNGKNVDGKKYSNKLVLKNSLRK